MMNIKKNIRLKYLKKIKIKTLEDVKKFKENFNKELIKEIKSLNNKEISIKDKNKKEIEKLSKKINDKISYGQTFIKIIREWFKDMKYSYNIVIILKNGRIKSFNVFEDKNIKGFNFKDEYYNISDDAIITQNNESFLFYKESVALPINFIKSNYTNKTFDLSLSGENLKELVDGKAFKGIVSLGKEDKSSFDWKIILIGAIVLILTFLHLTGQIDLVQMFKLG